MRYGFVPPLTCFGVLRHFFSTVMLSDNPVTSDGYNRNCPVAVHDSATISIR